VQPSAVKISSPERIGLVSSAAAVNAAPQSNAMVNRLKNFTIPSYIFFFLV
jgi:hypothetical protein